MRRPRGMTLLEVLVALAVLAIGVTALQGLLTASVRGIATDVRPTEALLLARSLLAEAEVPPAARRGLGRGDGRGRGAASFPRHPRPGRRAAAAASAPRPRRPGAPGRAPRLDRRGRRAPAARSRAGVLPGPRAAVRAAERAARQRRRAGPRARLRATGRGAAAAVRDGRPQTPIQSNPSARAARACCGSWVAKESSAARRSRQSSALAR